MFYRLDPNTTKYIIVFKLHLFRKNPPRSCSFKMECFHGTHWLPLHLRMDLQSPVYLRPEILLLVLFFTRTSWLVITRISGTPGSMASNQDHWQLSRRSPDKLVVCCGNTNRLVTQCRGPRLRWRRGRFCEGITAIALHEKKVCDGLVQKPGSPS